MLAASSPSSALPPGLLSVLDRLPPAGPFTPSDVALAVRAARADGHAPPPADDALAALCSAELVRRAAVLDAPELGGPAYLVDTMARPL